MGINKLPNSKDLELLRTRMATQFQLPSAYDDALSYQGLIYKLIQYLKDTMKNVEDWNEWLEDFVSMFDTKLQDVVRDVFTEWFNDGTIKELVRETLSNLQKNIDNTLGVMLSDYGLVPESVDGTFDNSPIIEQAIADTKLGGLLIFPDGGNKYNFSRTITIDKPLTFEGNGAIIAYSGSDKAIRLGNDLSGTPTRNQDGNYLIMRNFRLENANTETTTSKGIESVNILQGLFDNIVVDGFGINWHCIGRNNVGHSQNTFSNIRLFRPYITNLKLTADAGGWVTEETWYKGQFQAGINTAKVIEMVETDHANFDMLSFNQINFENRISDTVLDIGKANAVLFNHCRFEGLKASTIKISALTTSVGFINCFGVTDVGTNMISGNRNAVKIDSYNGASQHIGYSGSRGIITGINNSDTSTNGFPVFFTIGKKNPQEIGFTVGHEAISGYRTGRKEFPFFYVDRQTGKVYFANGYYELDNQPYIVSNATNVLQVMNDAGNIELRLGDGNRNQLGANGIIMMQGWYLWFDAAGNLRKSGTKPVDIDNEGTILG